MDLLGQRPDGELHHQDASHPAIDDRTALLVDPAALTQRRVGATKIRIHVEQRVEVLAAGLLLALDQKPHAARQIHAGGRQCVERPHPHEHLALVVRRAPGEETTVPHLGRVRRRRPFRVIACRLDVVVLHEVEERRICRADFAHDQRWRTVHSDHPRRRTDPLEPFLRPLCSALEVIRAAAL